MIAKGSGKLGIAKLVLEILRKARDLSFEWSRYGYQEIIRFCKRQIAYQKASIRTIEEF
jgi:hypothetical protein